ncbi:MAG: ribokinase [Oscillospiraceae bacterium]|jgi:sugar/nucleoside kinase (ribokinase family)|nr:ribokinase [Oscillospiraceae bacterium]
MKTYNYAILGQPSLDRNIDHEGTLVEEFGGAVTYAAHAAAALGYTVLALVKCQAATVDWQSVLGHDGLVDVLQIESPNTSIQNTYHTADRERRSCAVISRIAPCYSAADIPADTEAAVWHCAGLMRGDIGEDVIEALYAQGKTVAVDVQGFLRYEVEDHSMQFEDWANKEKLLPMIAFLKLDAAEAEIMTGLDTSTTPGREEAARMLHAWSKSAGSARPQEIMITHNTEVLIYDGADFYKQPLKPRNLTGRTGRGDTTFSTYICERQTHLIPEALLTAAALVSLKMEQPGPFRWDREAVERYICQFYPSQVA